MIDADAHARLIAGYCLDVRPGEQVVLAGEERAAPLLLALQREILERDAWPHLRVALSGSEAGFWRAARPAQIDGHAPLDLHEAQTTDASVRIIAPDNTTALAEVDPALLARAARARAPIQAAATERRWTVTLWPTPALAQQAGMATHEFAALVRRALMLNTPDPIAAWRTQAERQERLVERLSKVSEIRIQAPGTDITLAVGGRTWINSDGRRNLPSGEVFTGPLESSANGTVTFSVPSIRAGVDVRGVVLRFRDGIVVDARAEQGEALLQATLDTDAGARRLGELGIGTNAQITRPTGLLLLDEKIGGTIHLALGRSYPETGGVNTSAVHWDLVCDLRGGGRLVADGTPLELNARGGWS